MHFGQIHKTVHKACHKLQIPRIFLNDSFCRLHFQTFFLQRMDKIRGCYLLMPCAAPDQLLYGVHSIFDPVKAQRPKRAADCYGIFGCKLFFPELLIPQTAPHQPQKLFRYPVHALLIENSDPGTDGPPDRGIPDQIIFFNHGKQMQESLRTSGIHRFTHGLSGSLLQPGCKQKSAQHFIQLPVSAHHNPADQFITDHGRIPLSKQDILYRLYGFFISKVDLRRQNSRIGKPFRPRMVVDFRLCIAC